MGFIAPSFKDITMKTQTMECKIGLARFNGNFRRAQIWLDRKLMEKMTPYVPYRTGEFLGKIQTRNAGRYGTGELVTAVPPQGRYLYPGYSPTTGRPFHWTNPLTQPRWGSYTYQTYKAEFNKGVRHVIVTGRYPDGG